MVIGNSLWKSNEDLLTVNPFAIIPGFDILKERPAGFFEVLASVQIDFLIL